MIDNKKINTLVLTIILIEFVTIILGFIIGTSFYFCLKPFIYIGLTLFTYLFINKKYLVKREKKYINQFTIMAIIAYILLYLLSGIIFSFAYNPLVMKGKYFFLNIIYYIPTAISIELIRYRIITFINKENRFKYTIILSIIFAFSMTNISINNLDSIKNIIEIFYQSLVPNFVIGCFLCYVAINGSLYASTIYTLTPIIYNLFTPIIPNPQWIIIVLLKTFIPIITYTTLEKMKIVEKKKPSKIKKEKPYLGYIGISIMSIIILFACGIFRIYPVAIASNSMKPVFERGDIQIIDKKEQEYKIGDIIQFYGLNNTIFVHRVVSVRKENGNIYYTTKGDNNENVDLMEISQSRIIGKSIFTLKYLGYPTVWITENF